jgi:Flp pilus assembly protein TadG
MNQDRVRRYFGRFSHDRRGSTAVEFAIVGSAFFLMLLGIIGFGLRLFTQQVMQATALQTARCVAIGASDCCASASDCSLAPAYAVSTAQSFGVVGLTTSGVSIVKTTTDSIACGLPGSNSFVEVMLTLSFTSPIAGFLPNQSGSIVVVSCYPVTGS